MSTLPVARWALATTYTPHDEPLLVPDVGWRIGQTDEHHVDVVPTLFNHRICMTPLADPTGYDRGWCYATVTEAMLAALAWNPTIEHRPPGWLKEVPSGLRPTGESY